MSGTQRQLRVGGRAARPSWSGDALAAAAAALLAACGASGGSAGTAASTPPAGSSAASTGGSPTTSAAPATSAAQAAGGSMGCLAGTWRTNSISLQRFKASGGAGGTLTVGDTGSFTVNYSGIRPMTFSYNGVKGSMQYSGQESGQLKVSGSKLSGTTQSSSFKVRSQINGVSFNLPLPKVAPGTSAPWVGYTCSGNTLTLIEPAHDGTWSMTRVS